MVTGTTGARILALGDNCERSRNIADGHLVRVLLDLDLLVLDELGAARLQAQTAAALVDLAVLGLAHLDGHEGGGGDGLVGLGAAPVAGVRGHREHRLDLGGADDDALDVDELADLARLDLAHGGRLEVGGRAQVALEAAQQLVGKAVAGVARRVRTVQPLLGEQTVLDVHVQGVLVSKKIYFIEV